MKVNAVADVFVNYTNLLLLPVKLKVQVPNPVI